MNTRAQKILLFVVALALAISPLRGVLAMTATDAAGTEAHCAQMQDDAHAGHAMADMQDGAAPGHGGAHDCDGECCNDACNSCTHGSIALSTAVVIASETLHTELLHGIPDSFPGRSIHPLFRPPISL